MKTSMLCLLLFLAVFVRAGFAEEPNYCHDPAAEAEWIALLAENPQDLDLQTLHALRIGLCVKVDQGVLTVEKVTKIFERARKALIEQKESQKGEEMQEAT